MSHSASVLDSPVQPQKDEKSKLQANQTYAAAKRKQQMEGLIIKGGFSVEIFHSCVTRAEL